MNVVDTSDWRRVQKILPDRSTLGKRKSRIPVVSKAIHTAVVDDTSTPATETVA